MARANYIPVLEKDIEEPVIKYYKKRFREMNPNQEDQPLVRKMNGLGYRSWEDRLFIGPWGRVLWIEFKKPREPLSPLQFHHAVVMRQMGHASKCVDNVDLGKRLIDALFSDRCAECDGRKGDFYNIELCDKHAVDDDNTCDFDLVEVR